jgi:hypothetical protein
VQNALRFFLDHRHYPAKGNEAAEATGELQLVLDPEFL